jgi:hypothetical protein
VTPAIVVLFDVVVIVGMLPDVPLESIVTLVLVEEVEPMLALDEILDDPLVCKVITVVVAVLKKAVSVEA